MITITTQCLKETRWYEYAVRFVLGGLVTAGVDLLSKRTGPSFAGLFLAFPAILAASSTLICKHERERKHRLAQHGARRGRHAAGADAAGAAIGSLGLMTFAALVWGLLANHSTWLVIAAATLAWAAVSFGVWWTWKYNLPHRLARALHLMPHHPT